MSENSLNVRIQHAVIGEGSTTTSSVPKKGEVIFNNTLDNCRVGDGEHEYIILPNLLSSSNKVRYYSYTTAITLENTLNSILSSDFDIDTYNHIVIDAVTLNSNPSWLISGIRFYPLSTRLPTSANQSVYSYLRNHPFKTLKISVFSSSSNMEDRAIGLFYLDTTSTWQFGNLRWCPSYSLYVGFINNSAVDNTCYSIVAKHPSAFQVGNENKFGTTICITCVDPTNSIFLIE